MDEMQKALELDGEKLRQLTGEDHGPFDAPTLSVEGIIIILRGLGCATSPCGSQITCNPPPGEASDVDHLVEVLSGSRADVIHVRETLEDFGFTWEGAGEHYQETIASGFLSFRRDRINILVSANQGWCQGHRAATAVCKRLNLMKKDDRIALFQAVLYRNIWDESMKKAKGVLVLHGEASTRVNDDSDFPF